MNNFTREEIFVIKACKGHFDKFLNYGDARKIIQHLIYANPVPYFECELSVVTTLLQKTRCWTVEEWNELTLRAIDKARITTDYYKAGKFLVNDARQFEQNLINFYFGEIQNIQVISSGRRLIALDISEAEYKKIQEALNK